MPDEEPEELDPAYNRYDHLRRIFARYELGELTDDDFRQLKQQVLLGYATTETSTTPRIDLLVAVYPNASAIDAAVEALRVLPRTLQARIIDAAFASKYVTGSVRIRAIAGVTRTARAANISIAGAVCGLLFPADVLRAEQHSSEMAASMSTLTWQRVVQHELRAAGQGVTPGTSAIVIVCWPSGTAKLTTALRGCDSLKQLGLHDDVSDAIIAILADAHDEPLPVNG